MDKRTLTTAYTFSTYLVYRSVAMLIRKRFPFNSDLFRRIALMLPIFYLMNILMVSGLFGFFDLFAFRPCKAEADHFWWVYLFTCLATTSIVLINEAVFSSWRIKAGTRYLCAHGTIIFDKGGRL